MWNKLDKRTEIDQVQRGIFHGWPFLWNKCHWIHNWHYKIPKMVLPLSKIWLLYSHNCNANRVNLETCKYNLKYFHLSIEDYHKVNVVFLTLLFHSRDWLMYIGLFASLNLMLTNDCHGWHMYVPKRHNFTNCTKHQPSIQCFLTNPAWVWVSWGTN